MTSLNMSNTSLPKRIGQFSLILTSLLLFVYLFLPWLTNTVPVLRQIYECLQEKEIDPSRYYYTDVEEVAEAELYLREKFEK